jgi:hypothetical protein
MKTNDELRRDIIAALFVLLVAAGGYAAVYWLMS